MPAEGLQLWAKDLPLDEALHRFTVGDDPVTDLALVPWDILGSAAHARTLARAGLLSGDDLAALLEALAVLHGEALEGHFRILPAQEDGHTALEAALVARCGEAGKRIHLGRSRNDQVVLAFRLLLRHRLALLGRQVLGTARAFLGLAARHRDLPLPGYTHLRRAMPSTWGAWGAAIAEGLLEEVEALEALLARLDRCPSGAGAGFGVPLDLDRAHTAALLGFTRVQRSPLDVMNSRGRHEGAVADGLASLGGVLEKALWDLALFSTEEFGFLRLPDAFTTGSSIMPQKRNPDVVELGRAACRRLRGRAQEVHAVAGGLPSSYHRDLQLLKAPVLAMLDGARDLLGVMPRLLEGLEPDERACRRACTDEIYAAHAATALAASGLPFREAYRQVARELQDGAFRAPRASAPAADLEGPGADLERRDQALGALLERWEALPSTLFTGGEP